MNECQGRAEMISAFIDGELTADEAAQAAEHIQNCPACRRLLDEFTALGAMVAGEEVSAPEGFAGRVMERIDARRREKTRLRVRRWGALAAVCAIIIIAGAAIGLERGTGNKTSLTAAPKAAYDTAAAEDEAEYYAAAEPSGQESGDASEPGGTTYTYGVPDALKKQENASGPAALWEAPADSAADTSDSGADGELFASPADGAAPDAVYPSDSAASDALSPSDTAAPDAFSPSDALTPSDGAEPNTPAPPASSGGASLSGVSGAAEAAANGDFCLTANVGSIALVEEAVNAAGGEYTVYSNAQGETEMVLSLASYKQFVSATSNLLSESPRSDTASGWVRLTEN